MPVRWFFTWLMMMMSIVAMPMGNCQPTSLTTNYDAFLQAYYEWRRELCKFQQDYRAWERANSEQQDGAPEKVPHPEQFTAFYDKTRELATAAVQWCQQEPGLWRRFWPVYPQPKDKPNMSPVVDLMGYVSQKPNYTPEQIQALCPQWFYPKVHYYIVSDVLDHARLFLPSEQERVAWARQWLELSLQFYQSPPLRRADHYRAFDPFLGILDPSVLVVGYDTDFSYQAGLWRERATKEVRIRDLEERPRCSEFFEVLYSPVPLQQILPLDEPDYDDHRFVAFIAIKYARTALLLAGALPADDWLLIAGWQVWQLPKDEAFLRVRGGELYLSRRALQQLQVRFVVMGDRVVLWNGSYRQAVSLDGKDGFREGGEVWVRLLALKEKGLFEVAKWKGFRGKEYDIRMYVMYAYRPVADESGQAGGSE